MRGRRLVLKVSLWTTAIIAVLITSYLIYHALSRNPVQYPETEGWQTGDIFFSEGNSWKSDVVRFTGGKGNDHRTSHCGFVMMEGGKPMLVHMSTDKNMITMEEIREYMDMNDVSSVHVMRYRNEVDTLALRNELERLLKEGKKFDTSFDHRDSIEYYCTELVIRVFEEIGVKDFDYLLKKNYVYPQDLEVSGLLIGVDQ